MLRRATGQTVREYLTGRLFEPLGIRVCSLGGRALRQPVRRGGLWLRTRDAAKLPLLYLNQGQWQGRQLVSAAYVARASAKQIDTFNPGTAALAMASSSGGGVTTPTGRTAHTASWASCCRRSGRW